MESIFVEKTKTSPEVDFNAELGTLKISGRSIVVNTHIFYNKLIEWLNDYAQDPNEKTVISMHFEYLNTSSQKWIYDILRKAESLSESGIDIEIRWYYDEDDEDMMECGEDFQDVLKIPINILEVED